MNVFEVSALFAVVSAASLEYQGEMEYASSWSLDSEILGGTVEVSLSVPSGDAAGPFPLLVVLDGSEYLQTFAGYLGAASSYGAVPEMIVAGVDCGDHFSSCTPTTANIPDGTPVPESGGAGEFLAFLEEELVPAVENQYDAAPYTVLFGHSLAGLFTLFAMQEQGGVFEGFISSSPSLWWDSEMLTRGFPADWENGTRLFISLGNEGETMEDPFDRYLRKLDTSDEIEFSVVKYPGVSHQLVPFRSFIDGIEFVFQPWDSGEISSVESVIEHYGLLSETYGYQVVPPEGMLNRLGYLLLSEGRTAEAVEAFKLNRDWHPGSSNVYDSLGEGLLCAGDTAGAEANYRISLEMDPENHNAESILEALESP